MSTVLSLVIPCYNEALNLPLLLERSRRLEEKTGVELILVDNGSTDNSSAVLAELLPRYPYARSVRVDKNQGYGFGILSGLKAARGEFVGWSHADMQTDPLDALKALELLLASKDPERTFVKGKRYGRPFADVFFTMGMSLLETLLLRKPLWDINAQPNIFHKSFFSSWSNPPYDFSLDLYAYYIARKNGLAVKRFPVYFGKRAHGTSHWNFSLASKIKFIRRTLDFSLRLSKEIARGAL